MATRSQPGPRSPGERGTVHGSLLEENAEEKEEEPPPPKILPPGCQSLVKVLCRRLENLWLGSEILQEDNYSTAIYDTEVHLKRRPPNEIEAVLATMDSGSLEIIEKVFGNRTPNMHQFAEAIVRTGTYDADGVLEFMGGVVDLFLEVLWSQADRAQGADSGSVIWGQLMNHFIESPEIAMFEGTEITASLGSKAHAFSGETMPQMQEKRDLVDSQKHWGTYIEKLYWIQNLDSLLTIEGTESVYFWSPHPGDSKDSKGLDPPRIITPALPPDCYDDEDRPLYTVLGAAWDGDLDLTVLLSNRMLIVWRLRSREKFQFRQRAEYRIHAMRNTDVRSSEKDSPWKIYLIADIGDTSKPMGGHNIPGGTSTAQPRKRDVGTPPSGRRGSPVQSMDAEENQMRREKREDRKAAEYAHQLDIWWMACQRLYVTTDKTGKLCFWNIGSIEGTGDIGPFFPVKEATHHKRRVTCLMELGLRKFVSASLDRTFVVWDSLNIVAENKIEEHTASVLSVTYLQQFYSLVSVGCEKRVYVWSIDSTAYRGLTAKLSGHQANLLQVAGGNDGRGRIFMTLDEASVVILWDVATLQQLQSFCADTFAPKHALLISTHGQCCLASRRFYFYEANELLASYMGASPTKEQLAKAKSKPAVQGSFKERARPLWCGLNPTRGSVLSVTQAEVRLHCRGNPAQSRVVFCMPEGGEVVTSFAVMDSMHMALLGTSKGSLYFLKYRSGFALKVYEGRPEGEAWEPISGATAPPEAETVEAKQRNAASSPARGASGVLPGTREPRESLVAAAGAAESTGTAVAGAGATPATSAAAAAGAGYSKNLGRPPGTASREAHGGRSSEALGADAQAGEAGQDAEEMERVLEREQELKEVQQIVNMGFVEGDAHRAIQQVPRTTRAAAAKLSASAQLSDAKSAEDAEPAKQDADQILADARASNVEQAVEKLLTGAIATVGGEEAPPARLAARAELREGEEPQVRVKNLKRSHNAPSPEEIAKGLSRKIQCILPCEEQKRIYVGTVEGQVLVIACDVNFTVIRWITQPGPNMVAVTCLDCSYDGEGGLLLVGTQDNCAHLYGLPNLRLAGSINMGKVLPELAANAGEMISVRHAKLISMPQRLMSSVQFPLAVVTLDKLSRIRLWGIRLHEQSGKLEELALLLDGGQLYESQAGKHLEPLEDKASKDDKAKAADAGKADNDAKASKGAPSGKAGKIAAHAKAAKAAKSKSAAAADAPVEVHRPTVKITDLATIRGPVVIPEKYVQTLPPALVPEKPVPVAAPAAVPAAWAALAQAFASSGPADGETAEGAKEERGAGGNVVRGAGAEVAVHFGSEDEAQKDNESSGTEEDLPELLKKRLEMRPSTPDNGTHGEAGEQPIPNPPQHIDMDGENFLFLSDSGGRIWVLDAVATAVTAIEERDPMTVLFDENAARTTSKSRTRPSLARFSNGAFISSSTGSISGLGASHSEGSLLPVTQPMLSKRTVPAPRPEDLRVVTCWQAHTGWIQSIVPTTSPPALVTTDDCREVKVWSTTGDLWGDFTLYGLQPATVTLWPPPHVLGSQHALMNIAKRLCHRMGLPTSRDANKQAQKDLARSSKFQKLRRLTQKGATSPAAPAATAKSTGKSKYRKAKERKVGQTVTIKDEEEEDPSAGPPVLMTELPTPATPQARSPAKAAKPAAPASPPAAAPSATSAGADAGTASAALSTQTSAAGTPSGADAKASTAKTDGVEEAAEEEVTGIAEDAGEIAEDADDDDEVDLDALRDEDDEGDDAGTGKRRRTKAFTSDQIRDMIRNHGFSSGFQSYKQFNERGKNQPHQPEAVSKRRQGESLTQLEARRHSFLERPMSAFGVVIRNDKDPEHWERSVRDLGRRSASEGALLRYAQSSVNEMARAVRDDLGVDVSKISLKQMRKPSFIARLDVKNVSYDPSNPSSATAQAVRKVCNPEVPRRMTALTLDGVPRHKSGLAGAGSMMVGKRRH